MQKIHHSIAVHFAKVIFNVALDNGLDEKKLLTSSNLSKSLLENTEMRITPEQLSSLMHAIWQTADDEYLCLGSQPVRHGIFSMMAKQVIPSGNLRQVYRHGIHFYNLVVQATQFELIEYDSHVRFYISLTEPEKDKEHTLIELLLLLWHRFPSWLVGQNIPLTCVSFTHKKPSHFAEYNLMFPCKILYEQTKNYFEFNKEQLDLDTVQTQQSLSIYLRRCPLDWFQRQAYLSVYTRKVMDYFYSSNSISTINMQEIADIHHITTRTLRRKLIDEGTSFQKIKDDIRRDEAIHYLSQKSINITQISRLLGFTESATFTRAFKHWTGVSPSDYRKI